MLTLLTTIILAANIPHERVPINPLSGPYVCKESSWGSMQTGWQYAIFGDTMTETFGEFPNERVYEYKMKFNLLKKEVTLWMRGPVNTENPSLDWQQPNTFKYEKLRGGGFQLEGPAGKITFGDVV